MEQAIKFGEFSNEFVSTLLKCHKTVVRIEGRRFDRYECDNTVRFFVDRTSWEIFGAKSSFQYNPRRTYGTLEVITQYVWSDAAPTAVAGSSAERIHLERETELQKNYKPRGRPRKAGRNLSRLVPDERPAFVPWGARRGKAVSSGRTAQRVEATVEQPTYIPKEAV